MYCSLQSFRSFNRNYINKIIVKQLINKLSTKTNKNILSFANIYKNQILNDCSFARSVHTLSAIDSSKPNLSYNLMQKRFKTQPRKPTKSLIDTNKRKDDSDDDSDVEELPFDVIDTTIPALRLDNVVKVGLGIAREILDKDFGNFRINGESIRTKTPDLYVNDVIDYVRGLNRDNIELIDVDRAVIVSLGDKNVKHRVQIKIKKYKRISIENYAKDPYTGIQFSEKPETNFWNKT